VAALVSLLQGSVEVGPVRMRGGRSWAGIRHHGRLIQVRGVHARSRPWGQSPVVRLGVKKVENPKLFIMTAGHNKKTCFVRFSAIPPFHLAAEGTEYHAMTDVPPIQAGARLAARLAFCLAFCWRSGVLLLLAGVLAFWRSAWRSGVLRSGVLISGVLAFWRSGQNLQNVAFCRTLLRVGGLLAWGDREGVTSAG